MTPHICILAPQESLRTELSDALGLLDWRASTYNDAYPLFDNSAQLPDVFVINVDLPFINGMEICRWLKTQPETSLLPVILLADSPELYVLALNSPADCVVTTPLTTVRILEMVHEVLAFDYEPDL